MKCHLESVYLAEHKLTLDLSNGDLFTITVRLNGYESNKEVLEWLEFIAKVTNERRSEE